MKRIAAFSWGFWGWGTATAQLIAAVDTAEIRRGFGPPIFVDIRFRRTGRAPGFRGDAFEQLLGWRRYRWMPTLGNSNIGTRRAARIACPNAVNQLLDLALDAADRSARVIFFCACESPWGWYCHRHMVKRRLIREARRRRLPLAVQEWPGGTPSPRTLSVRVSAETLRGIARGAKAVALNRKRVPAQFAGIPWGTIVMLKAGRDEIPVAVGPATFRSGQWILPKFDDGNVHPTQDIAALRRRTAHLRRQYGLE